MIRCCIALKDSPSGTERCSGATGRSRHSRKLAQILQLGPGPLAEVALEEPDVYLHGQAEKHPKGLSGLLARSSGEL